MHTFWHYVIYIFRLLLSVRSLSKNKNKNVREKKAERREHRITLCLFSKQKMSLEFANLNKKACYLHQWFFASLSWLPTHTEHAACMMPYIVQFWAIVLKIQISHQIMWTNIHSVLHCLIRSHDLIRYIFSEWIYSGSLHLGCFGTGCFFFFFQRLETFFSLSIHSYWKGKLCFSLSLF